MGVVLYIMLCGYAPFHHDNVQRLFQMIMRGRIAFPDREWSGISEDAKACLQIGKNLQMYQRWQSLARDCQRHRELRGHQ